MRIAHTADVHLGMTRFGTDVGGRNSRINDFATTLRRFADMAMEHHAEYAVLAGDTFHTRRPGPYEIKVLMDQVRRMTGHGIHVIVGPGNHDGMGSIADPDTHTLAWMASLDIDRLHVKVRPEVWTVKDLVVASLPYAHKRSFESGARLEDRVTQASLVLEETIRSMYELAAGQAKGGPTMFVGHLSAIGARLGGEGGMQMGWDTTVDPACFDGFHYGALGHIHVQQEVTPRVWYAGAPDVHDFSDFDREPSFLMVDLEDGVPKVWRVPTGCRRIVNVVSVESPEGWPEPVYRDEFQAWLESGAIVRLDMVQLQDKLPPDVVRQWVSDLRERGASWVKVNAIKPESGPRTRAEGMTAEDDVLTATRRWLETQEVDPKPVLDVAQEFVSPLRTE